MKRLTNKQLGDAGEHFVCGMLGFHGVPTVKMPDNWPDFDLVGYYRQDSSVTIQVKTVYKYSMKGQLWAWTAFAPECPFDYLAAVVWDEGIPECWLIPRDVLVKESRRPGSPQVQDQNWWINPNDLYGQLSGFKGNWVLNKTTP